MKYILKIRREAELDIGSAFKYYEEQRLGLGHDFLLCVEEAFAKVERNPLNYRKIHKELRRIATHRFPYRIFYFVLEQKIIVTAVFHVRKGPKAWEARIRS